MKTAEQIRRTGSSVPLTRSSHTGPNRSNTSSTVRATTRLPAVAAFGANGNDPRQDNTGWDAGAARRKGLSSGGTGVPAGVDKTRTRFVGRS